MDNRVFFHIRLNTAKERISYYVVQRKVVSGLQVARINQQKHDYYRTTAAYSLYVVEVLQYLLYMIRVISRIQCCLFSLLCRWCLIKIYFKLQRLLQDSVHKTALSSIKGFGTIAVYFKYAYRHFPASPGDI